MFNHSHIVLPLKKNSPVGYKAWNPSSNLHNAGTRRASFWKMEMDSGKKAIMRQLSTG